MEESEKRTYEHLASISKRAGAFESIMELLLWDQEVSMPKKGSDLRANQLEIIAGLLHKEQTSKEFSKELKKLINLDSGTLKAPHLSERKQAALQRWRTNYLQLISLPQKFVEEFASLTSQAHVAWIEARERNDFPTFAPFLKKIVELNKKKADYLGYNHHPYDALIDQYEPGMTTTTLIELFQRMKIPLIDLIKQIQTKTPPNADFFHASYPAQKQLALGNRILEMLGLNQEIARLDLSPHPMCSSISPLDIRMTTRIFPSNLTTSIFSCMHEGGHGLYVANLPLEDYGTPLGQTASLGIDESQSRTWETLIGCSLPFWQFFFPFVQEMFPDQLSSVRVEEFYRAINLVKPSLIRTDSDEVTYTLHLLVRFEIEKGWLEGKIDPEDLPEIWNEKMVEYLGISPKADSEGCLQDIHWSLGAIGYFPTYILGNLYATQFFESFATKNSNWEEEMSTGRFKTLTLWQKENIHCFGRQYLPGKLCEKITGKPLSEEPYLNYLKNKYRPLYHLS